MGTDTRGSATPTGQLGKLENKRKQERERECWSSLGRPAPISLSFFFSFFNFPIWPIGPTQKSAYSKGRKKNVPGGRKIVGRAPGVDPGSTGIGFPGSLRGGAPQGNCGARVGWAAAPLTPRGGNSFFYCSPEDFELNA